MNFIVCCVYEFLKKNILEYIQKKKKLQIFQIADYHILIDCIMYSFRFYSIKYVPEY